MPNHITTKIKASEQVLSSMLRTHTQEEKTLHDLEEDNRYELLKKRGIADRFVRQEMSLEEQFVDFRLLIPEPENIEKGGCPGGVSPQGTHDDGTVCWYIFHVNNWGTKWNAYSTRYQVLDDHAVLTFETAWSHPYPILGALSKKFPQEQIEVWYADEDLGYNLGHYWIREGWTQEDSTLPQEGSEQACDFACQLVHGRSYADLVAEYERRDKEEA